MDFPKFSFEETEPLEPEEQGQGGTAVATLPDPTPVSSTAPKPAPLKSFSWEESAPVAPSSQENFMYLVDQAKQAAGKDEPLPHPLSYLKKSDDDFREFNSTFDPNATSDQDKQDFEAIKNQVNLRGMDPKIAAEQFSKIKTYRRLADQYVGANQDVDTREHHAAVTANVMLRQIPKDDRPLFLSMLHEAAQGQQQPLGKKGFLGKAAERLERGANRVGGNITAGLVHYFGAGDQDEPDKQLFLSQAEGIRRGGDPATSSNWVAKGALGATEMAPALAGSATATAASGPVGGFGFWYSQTAPELYTELRQHGIDEGKSKALAGTFAVPIAAIELLQFKKLAPQMAEGAKAVAASTLKQYLTNFAKEAGKDYTEQMAQEAMQSGLQVTAKAVGAYMDKNAPGVDWKQEWEGFKHEMGEAATTMPFLMAPGKAVDFASGFPRQQTSQSPAAATETNQPIPETTGPASETTPPADETTNKKPVKVGDLVQWTSNGVDQLKEPRRVTGVSDDGQFAFIEGTKTGVPASELTPTSTGEKANLPSQPTDIAAWIHANPEAAQSLSQKVLAGEKISRKDFVKAGLPAGSREVRTAFANQIHGVLLSMAQQQGQQQTQQPSQQPPEQGSQQPVFPPNQGPTVESQGQPAAEPPATIPGPAETGQQVTPETTEQQPTQSTSGYTYKPMDVSGDVSGTLMHHGTTGGMRSLKEADPAFYNNVHNLFGEGLYLTDSEEIAKGYKGRNGDEGAGQVLHARLGKVKLLDFEKPLPKEAFDIIAKRSELSDAAARDLRDKPGSVVFKALRDSFHDEGLYASDVVDRYQDIAFELETAGYDGLRHEGGRYTKAGQKHGPHNVVVLFDVNAVDREGKQVGRRAAEKIVPVEEGEKPTATPAQDALAAYAQRQGYDKIPTGKRGFGKRKVKDLINLRDSDVQHQALLKSAKAEARQQAATSTKDTNQADRAAAVEAGAQGKITPDVVKYAPLHTLPVELKQSIQDEAKRLITATKSDKVRTALERIIHDAGEDKGSAVEAQKQRIFGRLTGTVKTETFNEPPQPLDPIVKAITADPAERGKMIDAAVKSVEDGQPNDLALHADERLADANGVPQHQTPEGVDPFEHVPPPLRNSNADVTEWLEALRGSDHGQRELPPDSSAEQPFQLQNATPKPAPATFENKAGKQLNLIHGKDDLPGQQDLFPGMDNQNDEDVPEPVGAGSDAELGFPTRQQWDSDDPDTSGDIPSAIESPANAATSARPYIPPGPTMPTQRPATAVGKGASVVDVINAIRKATWAFGRETPIRIGHFRNKALGVFKVFPEVIRLKTANDVETAAHEIGHAIEKLVYGWNTGGPWKRPLVTNAMQQELSSLGRALYGNRIPAGGYKREGFAEYMRLWLTDPAAAKKAAPQFHGWFEGTFLPSHPKGAKYLQVAAQTFNTYSQQGAVERAKQNIVDPLSMRNRAKKFLGNVGKIFSPTAVEGLYPLKGLAKRAKKLSGNELPIHEDPYGSARALRSVAAARIKQMVENGMIDNSANYTGVAPLNDIKALVDEKDQGNFTALLWAQRAKALLEDPMGPRNPGPITIEDANEIIKELGTPKMLQAATLFHQWNDGVLDYVGQSSQTFQNSVDRIRARDPGFYSPLHREFDELERIWTASTGSDTNTGTVTGRLKGSGRRIINPLQVALTQAQQLVERAHERFILERVIGLQKIEGIGSLIEKVPPDRVVEMQKDLGQLVDDMTERLKRFGVELHDQQGNPIDPTQFAGTIATFFTDAKHAKNGEPIIPVYENGVTNWYYVDPGVYSALNKRNPSQVTEASKLIDWAATVFGRAPAHALRLGATGLWNPSFGLIINTIRDARTLSQNSQATNNFLVAYANVLKQVPWALADAVTNGKWSSDAVRTANRLGVKMAQPLHAQNPFTRRQASRLFGSKKILTLRNAGNLLDWVQNVIQFSDTAARAAEIDMLAKKEGIDLKQPLTMENSLHLLLAAKEVTTDFSEVGWLTGTFGQFVPFMRSSVNGPRAAGRAIARDPVAYLLKASATAVLAAGLWMLVKDEDWWKEMDANSKLRYFHIPIKWGGRDEVLQIPRNQDVDYVFGAGMTAALDAMHQKDPKAAMQWAGELTKSVNPVGAPPLLEEIYEQARNKDSYFGTPVVPPSLEDRPTHQQYNEHTSAVAKAVGSASKAVSDATGKDVRISPVRLDHAIGGLAGGGGRGIIQSLGGSAAEGETELADTPILGRLFRRGGPLGTRPESVADFYELQHQAEEKHSDIENPESDDDREKRLMMDDAKKGLSAISKMRQAATTVDERRELTRQSIELSKIAIEQYHSDDPDRSSITAAKKFYEYTAAVNGGDIQEARKQLKNLQASAKPRETVKRKLGEPIAKFRARAADQKQEHESARRALQLIRQHGLHAATVE